MNIIKSTILSVGMLGAVENLESKDITGTRNSISSITKTEVLTNTQVLENTFINDSGTAYYENAVESLGQMEEFVNDTTVIIKESFNAPTMTKLIQENLTLTKKYIQQAKNEKIDVSELENQFNRLEKEVYIKAAQYNITFLKNYINKTISPSVDEKTVKTHSEEANKLIQLANAAGADISEVESQLKEVLEKL